MPQPNDLSRSLVALDQNSTVIAVLEMSQSSWLVAGMLPGIERQPRKAAEQSLTDATWKLDLIINSHFHFDHVGGNALIPNATLVQRRESAPKRHSTPVQRK